MSIEKKLLVNFVEISGTVMDIYGDKVIGENEDWMRFEYMMKIRVAEDQIFEVKFSAKKSSKLYAGFTTLYDEVKTVAESGEDADRIRITGKLVSNAFYSKGKLYEKVEIVVNSANREKEKKFENNASFATLGYIEEHKKLEDGTANIRALINEYSFNGKVRGHEITFNVADKDEVDDYLEFFKEKTVCSLEGMLVNKRVKVEIDPKDLEELSTKGTIGSAKKKILEENERRKKLREEGVFRNEMVLELTGGVEDISLEEIEHHKYPFLKEDIQDMIDDIDERLDKSLAKDKERNPGAYSVGIDDDDLPF